jgi:hypothetical protein
MDPNETLKQIELIGKKIADNGGGSLEELGELQSQLRELYWVMVNWLEDGGFPPDAWQKKDS